MASPYSTEERIRLVKLYAKFENFREVRRQWKKYFPTQAPHATTIERLVKKFDETGSVHDREKSGQSP